MRFSFLTSKPPVFFPHLFSFQDCFFDKKQRTFSTSLWGPGCAQTPKVGVGLDFVWNLARGLVVSQIPETPLHFALGHHRKNKTSNMIGVEVATAGPRILISGVKSRALEVRFGHFPMKGGEAILMLGSFQSRLFFFFSEYSSCGEGFAHRMSHPLLLGVLPANTMGYPRTHIRCCAAWGEVSV